MTNRKSTQRGQALVLVALAIIGLVAFTALAVDGGNVFSDRRHSQNASDTAAYAAALAYIRTPLGNWKQAGIDRAANNGYSEADGVTEVDVYRCDELPLTIDGYLHSCRGLPAGANPQDYIYVHIKSLVKLYFAPVIGWRQVTNHTDAVVLAATPTETSWFPGFAIVSTMLGCPPYNHDPFTVIGNSGTTIINAGILVNSDCDFPQPAYDQGGSSEVDVDSEHGVCVVGRAESTNTNPPPNDDNCTPLDYSLYTLPNPGCNSYPDGKILPHPNGGYIASAGRYGPSFMFDTITDINPNDKVRLQKGVYCFYDGISLNAQWNITTDWNDNGEHDSDDEGVFLFVPEGDITFNGSSDIDLHAVDNADDFPEQFVDTLIYVPPTNEADIYITGANGSTYTGTILAPESYIRMNGGSGTVGLDSQIIGYAVAIEGNGTLEITYDADDNTVTTYNPSLTGIE